METSRLVYLVAWSITHIKLDLAHVFISALEICTGLAHASTATLHESPPSTPVPLLPRGPSLGHLGTEVPLLRFPLNRQTTLAEGLWVWWTSLRTGEREWHSSYQALGQECQCHFQQTLQPPYHKEGTFHWSLPQRLALPFPCLRPPPLLALKHSPWAILPVVLAVPLAQTFRCQQWGLHSSLPKKSPGRCWGHIFPLLPWGGHWVPLASVGALWSERTLARWLHLPRLCLTLILK